MGIQFNQFSFILSKHTNKINKFFFIKFNKQIIKTHKQAKIHKLTAFINTSVAQANYLSGEVRSQEWFHYGKLVVRM